MGFSVLLLALMSTLVRIDANTNFRGGYVTYFLFNEDNNSRSVNVIYASAWTVGATDCSGDSGPNIAQVSVVSNAAAPVNSANSRVNCNTANTGNTITAGIGTYFVQQRSKTIQYSARYSIQTPWFQFPCCTPLAFVSPSASITLEAVIPSTNTGNTAPNNPPQFANLIMPVIASGSSISINIPATDPEGDTVNCRFANQAEAGYLGVISQQVIQAGAGSCQFVINAVNKPAGEYPVGLMVEDFQSGVTTPLHSVPYQFVYTVTGEPTPTTPSANTIDAQVDCTQNNMRVTIAASEFTTGNAPAANQITFANQIASQCQSTFNGQVYTLQSDLSNCGTTYTGIETSTGLNPPQTYIVYENTVVVGRVGTGDITRDLSARIVVRCKYVREYTSENDKSYTATSLVTSQEEDLGQFTIQLRAFDSTFTNVQLSMSVSLRDRQYCQIDVTDNNFDTVVIVSRIFASNSATRGGVGEITHDLFINRCPNPADSTVIMSNQQSTRSQFRFSFEAFIFTRAAADSQVYVHCDTFICHESSTDPLCNEQCIGYLTQPNTNNVGRAALAPGGKKRRAISEEIESIEGKELIDLNAPSKTYFLVVGPYTRDYSKSSGERDDKKSNSFWNKENFVILASILVVLCITLSAVFYVKYQKMKIINSALNTESSSDMDIQSAFESKA